MTVTQARAQVFVTAMRSLSKSDRGEIIRALIDDPELSEDLCDILTAKQRLREHGRPLKEFESDLKRKGRL